MVFEKKKPRPNLVVPRRALENSSEARLRTVKRMTFKKLHAKFHPLHLSTIGQKPTFYPEIPLILILQKCDICEK